jgi:hypothetical protein
VFRDEFGFGEGLTISDCNDLNALLQFGIAANTSQASAKVKLIVCFKFAVLSCLVV